MIELNLQAKHSGLGTDEWGGILDALGDVGSAQRIARGFVPAGLELYFATAAPEYLVALSILCQGCLAVLNPSALGMASESELDPAILVNAKKAVQSPGWWLDVLDSGGKAELSSELQEIGKEWPKPSDGPMVDDWTKMHKFLGELLIARKKKSTIEPDALASSAEEAYRAVKARLESVEAANKA